jgi:hypothetical protein
VNIAALIFCTIVTKIMCENSSKKDIIDYLYIHKSSRLLSFCRKSVFARNKIARNEAKFGIRKATGLYAFVKGYLLREYILLLLF